MCCRRVQEVLREYERKYESSSMPSWWESRQKDREARRNEALEAAVKARFAYVCGRNWQPAHSCRTMC
jgi:hypothetical protein